MKKKFSCFLLLLLVLTVILSLSACSAPTCHTDKEDGYIYSLGEEIKLYDNESDQYLGSVVVLDAIVIRDGGFTVEEFDGYDEDDNVIYKDVEYEAVVQINYTCTFIDSNDADNKINFTVRDTNGNTGEKSPEVSYTTEHTPFSSITFAVKEKDEYITIRYAYDTFQQPVAEIKAYYDDSGNYSISDFENFRGSGTGESFSTPDNNSTSLGGFVLISTVLTLVCIAEGIIIVVLTVVVIILSVKYGKAKKRSTAPLPPTASPADNK